MKLLLQIFRKASATITELACRRARLRADLSRLWAENTRLRNRVAELNQADNRAYTLQATLTKTSAELTREYRAHDQLRDEVRQAGIRLQDLASASQSLHTRLRSAFASAGVTSIPDEA